MPRTPDLLAIFTLKELAATPAGLRYLDARRRDARVKAMTPGVAEAIDALLAEPLAALELRRALEA